MVFDSFALSNRLEILTNFVKATGRSYELDVLAKSLVGAIAVHEFRSAVPAGNDSVQTLSNDSVVSGVDNDGQERFAVVFVGRNILL
jgi:hypothetical protein